MVTPGYFRALNIPIIRGWDFRDEDRTGKQSEVILSRLMAATLFGKEDPIGKRLRTIGVHDGASEVVVGVAENVKNKGLSEQSDPEMYVFCRSVPEDLERKSFDGGDELRDAGEGGGAVGAFDDCFHGSNGAGGDGGSKPDAAAAFGPASF